MSSDYQNRLKSWALWASIAALIGIGVSAGGSPARPDWNLNET